MTVLAEQGMSQAGYFGCLVMLVIVVGIVLWLINKISN